MQGSSMVLKGRGEIFQVIWDVCTVTVTGHFSGHARKKERKRAASDHLGCLLSIFCATTHNFSFCCTSFLNDNAAVTWIVLINC